MAVLLVDDPVVQIALTGILGFGLTWLALSLLGLEDQRNSARFYIGTLETSDVRVKRLLALKARGQRMINHRSEEAPPSSDCAPWIAFLDDVSDYARRQGWKVARFAEPGDDIHQRFQRWREEHAREVEKNARQRVLAEQDPKRARQLVKQNAPTDEHINQESECRELVRQTRDCIVALGTLAAGLRENCELGLPTRET